ncbi:MAG: hypothetical protein EBT15_12295 [Betaproteobacteria bacterium]|nr:hypothetical protein [Betaproteobacteria bacterium]
MADYKATPEQWGYIYDDVFDCDAQSACILELRARVEALEAAQRPASKVYEISEPLQLTPEQEQQVRDLLAPEPRRNHPAKPDSSLVGRVSCAIDGRINPDQWLHQDAARAAIREVARWMDENQSPVTAQWLEEEADK